MKSKKLITRFENEFQRKLSPTEIETINELLKTYSCEEILNALKTSAISGAFNLKYIIKLLEDIHVYKQNKENKSSGHYDYNWLESNTKNDIVKDILANGFKKELIVYGIRPNLGAKTVICKTAKDCLGLGKKVLFYSFELPEEIILKRINADDEANLLVKSRPLKELRDMKDTIDSFKPDIVFIDYFQLMQVNTMPEDIHVLNIYAKQSNIPFVVLSQISSVKFKSVDFNDTDLEEVKQISPTLAPIIDASDRFMVFYDNDNKEYLLRELKNSFGEMKTFDIRNLLN